MEILYATGLIVFVIAFVISMRKPPKSKVRTGYQPRPVLFTHAERSFYSVLEQAVDNQLKIFAKVRVADILQPSEELSDSDWQRAQNQIASQHFDYILCQRDTLDFIAAIEFKENAYPADRSDRFLESVCAMASVPLIRIDAQPSYAIEEIRGKLTDWVV